MSIASPNPASFFAGQWSQIKDALIAAAGDSYGIAGQNGGKKSLETKNVPEHIHNTEAGTGYDNFIGWGGFWTSNATSGNLWQLLGYGRGSDAKAWLYATSLTGGASLLSHSFLTTILQTFGFATPKFYEGGAVND